ncbi:MAG TPA: hypothetical protein VNW53_00910 [Phenylobacterium sp.]|jgi:hypothetical protein|uniref:hypothetical protein n=1 Tax=Phenylobacterium sp. TaxID=1871053 RepID=UPI002C43DE04|nr:hypothetical protein [Phenylobacterium sp.]HXA37534.1 hypothetical protein [Phenylobacterium sp.]
MPTHSPEDVIIVGPDDIVEHDGVHDPARDPLAEAAAAAVGPDAAAAPPPSPGVDPNALLQSLASGATDPMSLLLSQISANAPDNPSVGMLASLLQRRDPPAPEVDEAAEAEAAARLDELTSMVDTLYAEVETLRSRSVEIAAALGACGVCFGSDLLCPRCGGRGRPGSRPPKPEAYRAYVLPAVMRVRRLTEAQRRDDPRAGPAPQFSDQGANHAGL